VDLADARLYLSEPGVAAFASVVQDLMSSLAGKPDDTLPPEVSDEPEQKNDENHTSVFYLSCSSANIATPDELVIVGAGLRLTTASTQLEDSHAESSLWVDLQALSASIFDLNRESGQSDPGMGCNTILFAAPANKGAEPLDQESLVTAPDSAPLLEELSDFVRSSVPVFSFVSMSGGFAEAVSNQPGDEPAAAHDPTSSSMISLRYLRVLHPQQPNQAVAAISSGVQNILALVQAFQAPQRDRSQQPTSSAPQSSSILSVALPNVAFIVPMQWTGMVNKSPLGPPDIQHSPGLRLDSKDMVLEVRTFAGGKTVTTASIPRVSASLSWDESFLLAKSFAGSAASAGTAWSKFDPKSLVSIGSDKDMSIAPLMHLPVLTDSSFPPDAFASIASIRNLHIHLDPSVKTPAHAYSGVQSDAREVSRSIKCGEVECILHPDTLAYVVAVSERIAAKWMGPKPGNELSSRERKPSEAIIEREPSPTPSLASQSASSSSRSSPIPWGIARPTINHKLSAVVTRFGSIQAIPSEEIASGDMLPRRRVRPSFEAEMKLALQDDQKFGMERAILAVINRSSIREARASRAPLG